MEEYRGSRNCYIYSQLNFDKVAKVMKWKKNLLFQQMMLKQLDIHKQKNKKTNLDLSLIPYIKINLK